MAPDGAFFMTKLTDFDKTIVALATALGSGGIALIRLSGRRALEIAGKNFSEKDIIKAAPNTIHHGYMKDNHGVIDEVLVSVFRSPQSYTGEDVVEISCHANAIIVDRLIDQLVKSGADHAGPGEFTLRAFLNGKIDLSQAEAVSDIIASRSISGLSRAMDQLQGGLSRKIRLIRQEIVDIISLLEIDLDFSEENLEIASCESIHNQLQAIGKNIISMVKSYNYARLFDGSLKIAIIGPTNAGKSTLLNAFLGEDRAITSDTPGTTRDVIYENVLIDNIWIRLVDTAGLRDTNDSLETEGIRRTHNQISESDLVVYVIDSSEKLSETDRKNIKLTIDVIKKKVIIAANKIDKNKNRQAYRFLNNFGCPVIKISAKHLDGVAELKKQIVVTIAGGHDIAKDEFVIISLRHKEILEQVARSINQACLALENKLGFECVAIDLRETLDHLGKITGETVTEDILNNIFAGFCIGK
jgi:tRNA modification GTPase